MTFSHPLHAAAALSLLAITACCPVTKQQEFMGNPQNPYPLPQPPKVGEIVHLPTGTPVTLKQMLDVAADARVVYVGETHDNPASHRLELNTLQGMEERHPGKVALGMEMFARSQQPVLDDWSAGKLDERAFVKASRWYDNWKMDFDYYRDLLLYARDHHIPVIGLNAEKGIVQALRSKPMDQLTAEEKAQLPTMDQEDPYQSGMAEAIFSGHSHAKVHMEGFLRVQTLWDETMAESAARFLKSPEGKDRHLVVVAGGNHVNYGFGIPRRVFRRIPVSYLLIGGDEISVVPGKEPVMMNVQLPEFPMLPYDFLAYYSYEALPKQEVLLGVMYEPVKSGHGLTVTAVVPGSNADRAGVKNGDVLLALDGQQLADSYDLVYIVKRKHVGDHSTLEVDRQGNKLQLEVVYQAGEPKQHGKP